MDKKEALERLTALEDEAKKLRAIIDAPEVDYEKWIRRPVVVSDIDPSCPYKGHLFQLTVYKPCISHPFRTTYGYWHYARLATLEECGFVDWSKKPDWANAVVHNQKGQTCWLAVSSEGDWEESND